MRPAVIEMLDARRYYRHGFSTGSVVLMNGCVMFHGTKLEAKKIYNNWTKEKKQ